MRKRLDRQDGIYQTNDTTPQVNGSLSKAPDTAGANGAPETLHVYASINGGPAVDLTDRANDNLVSTTIDGAGNTVQVFKNGDVLTLANDGLTWSLQDNAHYADGTQVTYTASVLDVAGNASSPIGGYQVQIDTQNVIKPVLARIADTTADPDLLADAISVSSAGLPPDIAGVLVVDHLGQNITGTVTAPTGAGNWQVRGLTTQLAYGETAAVYVYDKAGNFSPISNYVKYSAALPSSGGSTPTFQTTFSAFEDGNANDLVATAKATTNDSHLTFSGTVSSTNNTAPEIGNTFVAIYDNGNYVGSTHSGADGKWSFDYGSSIPGYIEGSHHNFTASVMWTNIDGKSANQGQDNLVNGYSVQMVGSTSTFHQDASLVGAKTSLSLSQLLPEIKAGEILQVKGDAGDVLDMGLHNGIGWIKTGTADGLQGDPTVYDVWQSYSGGVYTQILLQQGILIA